MTGMKKILITILLCVLLPGLASADQHSPLPCAGNAVDPGDFSRYASFHCDASTGAWRVHALPADALLDQLCEYGISNDVPLAVFHLELEGNIHTGVLMPVLRFYYVDGKKPINATTVSILADGVRYDLAAASTGVHAYGREEAEIISAPLTQASLSLIHALLENTNVSFRLIGDQIYTAELIDSASTLKRNAIQFASLKTLSADYSLLQAAGIDAYALWDLSAENWMNNYGFLPAYTAFEVTETLFGESISDSFGMILPGTESKAARSAQAALIEQGFLAGNLTNAFGANAAAAVSRAQKYYGLPITGCIDAQLERAMAGETVNIEPVPKKDTSTHLGDSAKIALERYWIANGVSTKNGSDIQRPANTDHAFLIADGSICNISTNVMHLFMQMEGSIIWNDQYAYDATILCEQNGGSKLDTMLLPMEEARLVVYAEIPGNLANATGEQWRIELSINGETIEYSLK